MLKRIVLAAAFLAPQVVFAADLDYVPRHAHHRYARHRHYVERNHVIRCTTTDLALFSYSDCGQTFDPLSISGI